MSDHATGVRSVLVVGTGLIGTSVALALREHGVTVKLADQDSRAVLLARELGAGEEWAPGAERVDLAVIAVPPQFVAQWLFDLQKTEAARFYTDVASVKALPITQAAHLGCDMSTYIAGHPLAGRERSGPAAARADVFLGRPWAYCPGPETSAEAVEAVLSLIGLCGGNAVEVDPVAHDEAVALVSHAPHVAASAMAARLADASETALGLAGPGCATSPASPGRPRPVDRHPVGQRPPGRRDPRGRRHRSVGRGGGPARRVRRRRRGHRQGHRAPQAGQRRSEPHTRQARRPPEVVRRGPGARRRPSRRAGPPLPGGQGRRGQHRGRPPGAHPGLLLGAADLSVQPESAEVLAEALRAHGWHVP